MLGGQLTREARRATGERERAQQFQLLATSVRVPFRAPRAFSAARIRRVRCHLPGSGSFLREKRKMLLMSPTMSGE